jgi:phage shock protein A
MGGILEWLLRMGVWVGLPFLLVVLVIGPSRFGRWVKQGWEWLWKSRLTPEEILTQVVRQHEKHITSLRNALAQAEKAEGDIVRNMRKSKDNIAVLEEEARGHAVRGDDLGARAALYKVNLERLAVGSFQEQVERQRQHITEARRRLYLWELQLRQYEVGKSILLSQLAEAKSVEQQYTIASNFDPFSAVANWKRAEGVVQEKAQNARAAEQVFTDVAEMPLDGQPVQVDPASLDAQLAALKAQVTNVNPLAN